MKQETINEHRASYSPPLQEGTGNGSSSSPRIRPMSKSELAMAYAPNLTVQGAVNRLMDWIHHNPELTESLLRTGYRKSQKLLTSLQVRIIFDYLGEP